MDNALNCAMDSITSQASYPYTARQGVYRSSTPIFKVTTFSRLPPSETALIDGISQEPIAVAIKENFPAFQFYHSDIFDSDDCGTVLDQALLVVAFTSQYYIVKNSWGTSWGNHGYINIARGKKICDITSYM